MAIIRRLALADAMAGPSRARRIGYLLAALAALLPLAPPALAQKLCENCRHHVANWTKRDRQLAGDRCRAIGGGRGQCRR
jgi:hypothetical protein